MNNGFKKIDNIFLGFSDAEFYKNSKKDLFDKIFVRNKYLDALMEDEKFFILGDKGTGKTAYSVFLANNDYKNTRSYIRFLRETEYLKFITLKDKHHLDLSTYTDIWKVVLLILFCEVITEKDLDAGFLRKSTRVKELKECLKHYSNSALSPEVIHTLNFIENSEAALSVMTHAIKASIKENQQLSTAFTGFQTNLLKIYEILKNSLSPIKLNKNITIYVDGIDTRPSSVSYDQYLNCIKGLANAIWNLNADILSTLDSKFKLKIVMLLRPDIFASLGMSNLTNKLQDNSVFLDWRTRYPTYRNSLIFEMADRLFAKQQDFDISEVGKAWDHYCPWTTKSTNESRECDYSFINFLRNSYARPRDILVQVQLMKKMSPRPSLDVFSISDFQNEEFKAAYSEYLLGSLRDELLFYYPEDEFDDFLAFFKFLRGKGRFSHAEYRRAYMNYSEYLKTKELEHGFAHDEDSFLQFLYDKNVISYTDITENKIFHRYSYREKNIANISPKVRIGADYEVHYGLLASLNLGAYEILNH